MERKRHAAENVAQMGMLFALAIGLSFLEGLIPSPFAVPGIKLGLSNIVIMYALFAVGGRRAVLLTVLKALFVVLTRSSVAGLLAFCGGVLSVAVMLVLVRAFSGWTSYSTISISGSVAHNLGQLLCAALLLKLDRLLWYYLPVLVASGVVMGLLTAALLRVVMPLLQRARWAGAPAGIPQKPNTDRAPTTK